MEAADNELALIREARNRYMREYRKRNKEKIQEHQKRWLLKQILKTDEEKEKAND